MLHGQCRNNLSNTEGMYTVMVALKKSLALPLHLQDESSLPVRKKSLKFYNVQKVVKVYVPIQWQWKCNVRVSDLSCIVCLQALDKVLNIYF